MSKIQMMIILGVVAIAGCSSEPEDNSVAEEVVRPAKIVQALPANGNVVRTFPGTVEAATKSDLAFRVGGQLSQLKALPGMSFKKGDLLAKLDDRDYRNALQDRQARYTLAKSQYDKVTRLRKSNHASPSQEDEVEANLKAAEAALKVAEDNLAYTELHAPFNGVVANVHTENYQVVNPNQMVIEMRGDDKLDVRFDIPERLLGKLKQIEDPSSICVSVRFNTYPSKSYPACFKEYESNADSLTRTYSVVNTMEKPKDFPSLPGMAVTVEVNLSGMLNGYSGEGVLVPLSAVFEDAGKSWVWRLGADSAVEKTEVVIGGVQNDKALLLQGLAEGDAIVEVGVRFLQQGQKVRPLRKERGL